MRRGLGLRGAGLALATVFLLLSVGRAALADHLPNHFESDDFDRLYKGSMGQEDGGQGVALKSLDLSLGSALDGVEIEVKTPQETKPLGASGLPPTQSAEHDADEGAWKVVPILPKRQLDEDSSLIDDLTPVGLGFVREF